MLWRGRWLLLPARYRKPLPWSPLFIFSWRSLCRSSALGVWLRSSRRCTCPASATSKPGRPWAFQACRTARSAVHKPCSPMAGYRCAASRARSGPAFVGLLATRRMPGKEAVHSQLALADPSDDVRLLAYSMLDKPESEHQPAYPMALEQLVDVQLAHRSRSTAAGALVGNWPTSAWPKQCAGARTQSGSEHSELGLARARA